MPDGLRVSINLVDGQTIPNSGYTITVTPLGSSSLTIKTVAITIDGSDIQTVTPDNSGTVRWNWDPNTYPGTHIQLTITASDNTMSSYPYTIKLAPSDSRPGSTTTKQDNIGGAATGLTPGNDTAARVIEAIKEIVPEGVKQVFRNLPQTAINSFPYAFFLVLGLVAVTDLLLIKRELRASRVLMDAIGKQKVMIELKNNFLGLASHYLRTPLTVIIGGIDLMESEKSLGEPTLSNLKSATNQMSDHVKTILDSEAHETDEQDLPVQTHSGTRIGVSILILSVTVAAALFNLIAFVSGRTLPGANLMTQVAAFLFVGLAVYQADRRLVLHRLERRTQDKVLERQQNLQRDQDEFIEQTATQLYADYEAIAQLATPLPAGNGKTMIDDGLRRYKEITSKCKTAQLLKGSHSSRQPAPVNLTDIFRHDDPELANAITTKAMQFTEPQDRQVVVPEPELLRYVTRSVIDNAVAYSSEKGMVTLDAHSDGSHLNLAITDGGKGISKQDQTLLFQPLSKVEGYQRFDHTGMGFSLYLDKLIMQYLGGDIVLESEENQGTTVNLSVPVAVQSGAF
jgi:signal transduction histidine kinase